MGFLVVRRVERLFMEGKSHRVGGVLAALGGYYILKEQGFSNRRCNSFSSVSNYISF